MRCSVSARIINACTLLQQARHLDGMHAMGARAIRTQPAQSKANAHLNGRFILPSCNGQVDWHSAHSNGVSESAQNSARFTTLIENGHRGLSNCRSSDRAEMNFTWILLPS